VDAKPKTLRVQLTPSLNRHHVESVQGQAKALVRQVRDQVNEVIYADTIANLRSLTPGTTGGATAIFLKGYWTPGDGGGGMFFWDPAQAKASDDGGTVIAPTGVTKGCWMRLLEGQISVRWFGAKGDGATDDTRAIQAAVDVAQAERKDARIAKVVLPAGQYVVGKPPSSTGIVVNKLGVIIEGLAASQSQKACIQVAGGVDGITIRDTTLKGTNVNAQGTIIRHLEIKPLSGVGTGRRQGTSPATGRHGVVVTAASVTLEDLNISFMLGNGIFVQAEANGRHYADLWTVRNCAVFENGGNGLHVKGGEANAGLCEFLSAVSNEGYGILDESFLGSVYVACHTNANGLLVEVNPPLPNTGSYKITSPANYSTFVGCYAELNQNPPDLAASAAVLVVGGNLAGQATNSQRVGYGYSQLRFRSEDTISDATGSYRRDVSLDTAQITQNSGVAMTIGYTAPGPAKKYRDTTGAWNDDPYTNWWALQRKVDSIETSNNPKRDTLDRTWVMQAVYAIPNAGDVATPFGWTDRAHPQGPGLFFLESPRINRPALWTYRIPLKALPPGGTTIPTLMPDWISPRNPGQLDVTFAISAPAPAGTNFAGPIDVFVGPYTITETNGQWNLLVRVYNMTSSTIPPGLSLVAHIERYKTWFDSGY
jgi:pectate lyase-like protein